MTEELPPQDTPTSEPVATPEAPTSTEFTIPDEYKEKSWAGKVKTQDDLYKQLDNLTSLVGKKSLVPEYNPEKPEEFDAFLNRLRPESADKYEFPEGVADEIKSVYGEALHFAGVHPSKVNGVMEIVSKYETEQLAKMQDPVEFDKLTEEAFGANWKKSKDESLAFLRANLPNAELLDKLPNAALIDLYKFANKVATEYGAKESGSQAGGGQAPVKVDMAVQANELLEQITQANAQKPPDFKKLEGLKQQLREINQKRAAQ